MIDIKSLQRKFDEMFADVNVEDDFRKFVESKLKEASESSPSMGAEEVVKSNNLFYDGDGEFYAYGEYGERLVIDMLKAFASSQQPGGYSEAESIVKELAEWSLKYPRGPIYPMSKKNMDDELIAIEEKAKQHLSSLTQQGKSSGIIETQG